MGNHTHQESHGNQAPNISAPGGSVSVSYESSTSTESAHQAGLAALKSSSARGSKLIIAGVVSTVFAVLIFSLISVRQSGGILLLVMYSVAVLTLISGAAGWAGWVYLKQALKLLRQLEFDSSVDPSKIKFHLSGSSLASASTLLLRLLCVFVLLISAGVHGFAYGVFIHAIDASNSLAKPIYALPILSLLFLPYFLVAVSPRISYLNPENWNRGTWIMRRFFNKETNMEAQIYRWRFLNLTPDQISRQDSEELIGECIRYFPTATAITMNMYVRKLGVRAFFGSEQITEDRFEEDLMRLVGLKIDEFLNKRFPGMVPDIRATLKEYYVKNLYKKVTNDIKQQPEPLRAHIEKGHIAP